MMVRDAIFRKTCSEGSFLSPLIRTNKCRYLHHNDAYLHLGPFTVEIVRIRPYVSIFHDILTEREINWLISYSSPNLSRSRDKRRKLDRADGRSKVINKAVQYWMHESEIVKNNSTHEDVRPNKSQINIKLELLYKLSKKISMATQLETLHPTSSSKTQITNYGLGGLCEIHADPYGYIEGRKVVGKEQGHLITSGDFFGTFMAWLNHVEGGGGTAFVQPYHEMLVQPTRGSAAFWHNLDKKGFRKRSIEHGGCPVIKGTKWILNKWMYYFDNFHKFKCSLSYKDTFSPPNGQYENWHIDHE